MKRAWTETDIRKLGVRTDVETAGSIFGLSRTQTYVAIKAEKFPVHVIKVGRRLIVPVAPILDLLGIGSAMETAGPAPPGGDGNGRDSARIPADRSALATTLPQGRQ